MPLWLVILLVWLAVCAGALVLCLARSKADRDAAADEAEAERVRQAIDRAFEL